MLNKWKSRIAFVILTLLCVVPSICTRAETGTIYDNKFIEFSPDGQAFTTNADDKNVEWYKKGTTVDTNISSSLRDLNTGEHYYLKERKDTVPVSKWEVAYYDHYCIHNNYAPEFHLLEFTRNGGCKVNNYSGWVGFCADCGEEFTYGFIYMSKEAAQSLKYVDLSKDYYYLCPFDKNLEQGYAFHHLCKAISWNKYQVIYHKNGAIGGDMAPTTHMFNNETIYEGRRITPDTKLRKNTYIKLGYEFIGWNTEPDGSGTFYTNEQEVLNLTKAEISEDSINGKVHLYAQWKQTSNTLEIDPNGGTYENKSGITSLSGDYGKTYTPKVSQLTPPAGAKVSFDTHGGNTISPIVGTQTFKEWQLSSGFQGKFQNGIYTYQGPANQTDRLTALYTRNPITLPTPSRDNASFAGWYYDEAGSNLAGYGGERITPNGDITLHAKWVTLILTATNVPVSRNTKGAVDLVWLQPDTKEKTYYVKQKREGGDWVMLTSATDANNAISVKKTFAFSGKPQTYQVPYSGYYTLTATGAQGGGYDKKIGGKGGKVTGKFFLEAGDVLTYTIGGQNGYHGGGAGRKFGTGGGYTIVTSKQKGDLLIAGGGGGATSEGNGGAGGSSASLVASGHTGGSGMAGGGGGAVGGNAGEYIVHNHSESCYQTDQLDYELMNRTTNQVSKEYQTYLNQFGKYTNKKNALACNMSVTGDYFGEGRSEQGFGVTANCSGDARISVSMGMYDYDNNTQPHVPYFTYFPTNGNTKVAIQTSGDIWTDGTIADYQLTVYNQNNQVLKQLSLSEIKKYSTSAAFHANPTVSGWFDSPSEKSLVRFYETISLPEGTTGIRMTLDMKVFGSGHFGTHFEQITFSGGTNQYLTCAYADKANGYVVSSKPAYGGSNYINQDLTSVYTDESGIQEKNGTFSIEGKGLGYQMANKLDNVSAPDLAAPDAPVFQNAMSPIGTNQVRVTWNRPKDNGTLYYHQVTSYTIGKEGLSKDLDSNITENTLTMGVKGYYYYVSDKKGATPSTSWTYLDGSTPYTTVTVTSYPQYLHVVAIDWAGNLSQAAVKIIAPAGEETPVNWQVSTSPITIPEEENVYRNPANGIYYVRADGQTPFQMNDIGFLEGSATTKYQVDWMQFQAKGPGGTESFAITIPYASVLNNQSVTYQSGLDKQITQPEYLSDAAYTKAVRSNWLKDIALEQQFTIDSSYNGQTIQVIPRAAAENKVTGIRTWSDAERDAQNGVTLIPDAEAPTITGTDRLKNLEIIDKDAGDIILTLNAQDSLSGVQELSVFVQNTDNYCEKTYTSESGTLTVNITQSDYVFNGDFTITITATDKVGNVRKETYCTTEFSLQVKLERILEPHDPKFKCGESGILYITTTGYADKVEVIFPDALLALNPELNKTYVYELPSYLQQEELEFMVPLYTPVDNYVIQVNAYKKGQMLHETPRMSTTGVDGTVLDEFRTRLR